jgi:flagellar hook assembly protein FlgD
MNMFESLLGEPHENLPMTYQLYQNYPNPFNPSTTIKFYLPHAGSVTLSIYNIMGQKVAVLLDGYLEKGPGETIWDGVDQSGKPVATGIYFYRFESDEVSITKRMLLLK